VTQQQQQLRNYFLKSKYFLPSSLSRRRLRKPIIYFSQKRPFRISKKCFFSPSSRENWECLCTLYLHALEPDEDLRQLEPILTIVSYNAGVAKFFLTQLIKSIVRFLNKKYFYPMNERCSLLQRWRCEFKSRRIGSRSESYDLSYNANVLKIYNASAAE
jgi:hypothetical protein